jgi:glycosyltransferase involved in cell wall biosynthesis
VNLPRASLTALICAYNEADRISRVLETIVDHPLFGEIIVVDDGSTDATAGKVRAFPQVTLISYPINRGKTYALARGIDAARCDHLMLLDADLAGMRRQDIEALARPVLTGKADVSLSLRRNSLGLYRLMGLDFVSGERVLPRALLANDALEMMSLPRWGGEVFINQKIINQGLRVSVVDWRMVSHTPKGQKVGAWQGVIGELGMMGDALRLLSPLGVVRQNMALLRLVNSH